MQLHWRKNATAKWIHFTGKNWSRRKYHKNIESRVSSAQGRNAIKMEIFLDKNISTDFFFFLIYIIILLQIHKQNTK